MTTTFDGLLRSIHPNRTLERFEREAAAAVLQMPAQTRPPRDARELMMRLAALQYRMSRPEGDRTPFPMHEFDLYARLVNQHLSRHYGGRGIGVAMQIVQADHASGFREMVDVLARMHVPFRTRFVVRRRVDQYWQQQSAQGRILAAKYYLAKFSMLLATDQRHRDPVRLATILPNVLYEHPFRVRELIANDRIRR